MDPTDSTNDSDESANTADHAEHAVSSGGIMSSPLVPLAATVVVVAGVRGFSEQLAPLALALVLIIAVTPVQGWLRRKGAPGWAALLGSLAAGYGILLALVAMLSWSLYEMSTLFTDPEYSDGLGDLQDQVAGWLQDLGVREGAISDAIADIDVQSVIGRVGGAVSSALGVVSAMVMVLVAMFFMATDATALGQRINDLAKAQPLLNSGIDGFVANTRSYLWVSTVFGAAVAVADGIALWLLGIPLVGVWIVLSFVTNYIPNVGFVVGVIPPAIVAAVIYDVERMIWVVIIYSVLNFVIQTLIQPRIVGDSVGLSTTLTFLSLVFWSFVIGPLGAVLAVPLTLMAKALLVDINPSLQWMRPLLSLKPLDEEFAPPPESPFDAGGAAAETG